MATTVWLLSRITGVRARAFVAIVMLFSLLFALINSCGAPGWNRRRNQLDSASVGEVVSVPEHGKPGWWVLPVYLVVLAVDGHGVFAGVSLFRRDRVAGLLVALASAGAS